MNRLCKHFSEVVISEKLASKLAKGTFFSLLLMSLLGFSSCSEDEIEKGSQTKLELSFNVKGTESRGRVTREVPIGTKVGVMLDGGASTDYDIYTDLYYTCGGTEENRTWTPSQEVGTSSNKATLYAYWPYTPGTKMSAIPVDMTVEDQTDWLYATPVTGICSNNAKIQATLNHALANISVSFDKGTYLGTGNITKIAFKGQGIASKGTFNAAQATPDFTKFTNKGEEFARTVNTTPGGAAQEMMVIPTGVESEFTFIVTLDGTEFQATTEPINLQKGYSYHYTLKLGSTSMEISTFTFAEWQTEIKESIQVDELDRYADWIQAVYEVDEASVGTEIQLLGSTSSLNISSISRMVVDGEEVTPSKTFVFSTSGKHKVKFLLAQKNEVCMYMFSGITNVINVKLPQCVTEIKNLAFNECTGLTEIIIPNSVKLIGKQGFYKSGLEHITIPNSVTSIADYAFEYCYSLKQIEFGNALTSIGQAAFEDCTSLNSIEINSPITSIGMSAFRDCEAMESVVLNNTSSSAPLSIPTYAFEDCKNLTSVVLNGNISDIYNYAFNYCYNLKYVQLPNSLKSIAQSFSNCTSLESIEIPNSVTKIGEKAFYQCTGLREVNIGTGLVSLGDKAFYNWQNIEKINVAEGNAVFDSRNNCNALMFTQTDELLVGSSNTVIPDNCKSIAPNAFFNCKGLKGTLVIPNSVQTIGKAAFYGAGLTGVVLPNSITEIADETFRYSLLEEIDIPANVKNIGEYSFGNCNALGTVEFHEGLEKFSNYAFYQCIAISELEIPNSVIQISYGAFNGCSLLSRMKIGTDIASIGDYAFAYCTKFIELQILATTPPTIASNTFRSFKNYGTLVVPEGTDEAYSSWMNTSNYYLGYSKWRCRQDSEPENGIYYSSDGKTVLMADPNYTGTITFKDGIEKIANSAFYGCEGITGNLTIPNSVTSIGQYAFQGCKGLTGIELSESLTKIEQWTFYECDGLMGTIDIPNSVQTIGMSAFYGCNKIIGVNFGSALTSIDNYAFQNCLNLKTINILATTAPTIQSSTFRDVASYGTLTVPAGCTSAYSKWMQTSTSYYYLGRYSWTCMEAAATE